jgi:hypothetical protein
MLDNTDIDGLFSTLSNGAEEKHAIYWKIKTTIYDCRNALIILGL